MINIQMLFNFLQISANVALLIGLNNAWSRIRKLENEIGYLSRETEYQRSHRHSISSEQSSVPGYHPLSSYPISKGVMTSEEEINK